jgi:hypothetical protein
VTADTPLQRLDDAVHEFFRETGVTDDGKWITGWVIAASTARTDHSIDDIPLVTGAQYALGPQTSTTDAAGLARFLDVVIERATWNMLSDDD